MTASPGDEGLKILTPALDTVHGDSGHYVGPSSSPFHSSSDDHGLGVGVLNGAGMAVINTI